MQKIHYKQLWKRIKNTLSKLRLRKAAKSLIWVNDELQVDSDHPASEDKVTASAVQVVRDVDERTRTEAFPYNYVGEIGVDISLRAHQDIDFTRQDNLEEYFREMTVTKESLQSWISAGILSPHEVRIAEKWIKIMREKDLKRSRKRDN